MGDEPYTTVLIVSHEVQADYGSGQFLHLKLRPAKLLADGKLRNFMEGSWPREHMADLVISAQADENMTTANGEPYGWHTWYEEAHRVELDRAKGMVSTLSKVERGLRKLESELGYPETFAGYAARVAKILGVSTFLWAANDRRSGMYDDTDWTKGDAVTMSHRLSFILQDWRTKVNA